MKTVNNNLCEMNGHSEEVYSEQNLRFVFFSVCLRQHFHGKSVYIILHQIKITKCLTDNYMFTHIKEKVTCISFPLYLASFHSFSDASLQNKVMYAYISLLIKGILQVSP